MFPKILKELRKRRGVTQIQLASALGVSPGNVGDWETGKSCPSYHALIALSKYFCVSADTLLGLNEGSSQEEVMSPREENLLRIMRTLDRRDQDDLLDLAEIKLRRMSS